jgi:hypothetical protein
VAHEDETTAKNLACPLLYEWRQRHASTGRPELGTQTNEGVEVMSKKHHGSSLDAFLKEEGFFEESQSLAVKEVIVWQRTEAMRRLSRVLLTLLAGQSVRNLRQFD